MNKGRTPLLACGPFLLALLLAACGDSSRPSAEEREQLDNAAEMLNEADNLLADVDDNALEDSERNLAQPDH